MVQSWGMVSMQYERDKAVKKAKIEKYVRTADFGDNAASKFVNYGVKKKYEGRYALNRALMILAYVVFVLAYAAFFISMSILPIIALLPVLTWILIFSTWRYVSIEYEYYILDGEFCMLEVYGSKSMRELCRVRISAMKSIAPYRWKHRAKADAIPTYNRIEGVSSMHADNIYYGIFTDADGEDRVVFFEVTEKTLKVLKYYNSDIEIVKTAY